MVQVEETIILQIVPQQGYTLIMKKFILISYVHWEVMASVHHLGKLDHMHVYIKSRVSSK